MKRSFSLILMLMPYVFLIACGGGGGGGHSDNPVVNPSDVKPIVGTWEYTESNCTETLEFYVDKTFKSSSHLEILTGTYELNKKSNSEYTLSMYIQNDNGGLSCPEFLSGGSAENDTGSRGSVDVIITGTQLVVTNGVNSLTYQKK